MVRSLLTAVLVAALSTAAFAQSTQPRPFTVVPLASPPPAAPDDDASPDPDLNPENKPISDADRKEVERAKEWFTRIQTGDIDRSQLTPAFNEALTDAVIGGTSARLKPYGDPVAFANGGKFQRDGVSAYVFRVNWKDGGVLYQFSVDDATDKIAGFFTRPAPPANLTR